MTENNAAQAAEQAIKAAIRKAYDDGYNDAKMAPDNCSTYCVERAVRLDSAALLSKLRAPVADTPRVDELMAKWDDDGATRGPAFIELRDLARALERRVALAGAPVAHVAGDEVSRRLEWAKDRSAWERPVGTPVYYSALASAPAPATDETYTDEKGTVWTRPTAWAYAQVCKARDKWQAAASAPVADERVPFHDRPQQTGVGEWCAPGPAAEQRQTWMLRFADTERGDCIYYDEQEARRAFAQAEGRGWNCYLFEYARRAAPATGAFAGAASTVWKHTHRVSGEVKLSLEDLAEMPFNREKWASVPHYAAPQASEAVRGAGITASGDAYRDSEHFHKTASIAELGAWQRGWDDCRDFDDKQRAALSEQPGAQKEQSDE